MKDLRQSSQYANYLRSIGWKIEQIDHIFVYLKKIPILGYFAKIQRPSLLNDKVINFIEKKYHPFQFSIEPLNNKQINLIKNLNFKTSNSPSLPTKTSVINLSKSESNLLKSFSQKTRYNIHNTAKRRVKVIESKNILDFTSFWRENFEKKRFPFLSQQKNIIAMHNAFDKNSKILLAKKDNKIIAVLFVLLYDKTAYYMYAASNDTGRSNFAPTLLTWQAILLSKKSGCKTFDFDGIYDDRFPIKSWLGFTKFKKGFRGQEIKYPGRFVKNKI
jgi:peptidoglycan pentaglycine glycine transferase (the first glycine)